MKKSTIFFTLILISLSTMVFGCGSGSGNTSSKINSVTPSSSTSSNSNSANISRQPNASNSTSTNSNSSIQYMSDIIQPYHTSSSYDVNKPRSMAGVTYTKDYAVRDTDKYQMDFNLQGQYNRITALIGQTDNGYNTGHFTIDILADGVVIKTVSLEPGGLPQQLDLAVSGVTKLEFNMVCLRRDGDIVPEVLIANPKIQ